jgi:hypothetical protein
MPRRPAPLGELVEYVLGEYLRLWQEEYGPRTRKPTGRDRTRTREALKEIGPGEMVRRLESYFSTDDRWVADRSHPYGVFLARLDDYAGRRDRGKKGIARHGSFDIETERKKRGR